MLNLIKKIRSKLNSSNNKFFTQLCLKANFSVFFKILIYRHRAINLKLSIQ